MRKSISIAARLAAAACATGTIAAGIAAATGVTTVGASSFTVPHPFKGSDTLFVVTQQSVDGVVNGSTYFASGEDAQYIPTGSGGGQNAMTSGTTPSLSAQQTAPMSKMMTNGICSSYGGSLGSAVVNATGIAIGMDAIDIMASNQTGSSSSCTTAGGATGQTTANDGMGYANSLATNIGLAGGGTQNWKWVLAMVYGGLDLSPNVPTCSGTTQTDCKNANGIVIPECNSTKRQTLVNNYAFIFQTGTTCSTAAGSALGGLCGDTAHKTAGDGSNVPVMHVFRRDDASGTADVFSALIGLQIWLGGNGPSNAKYNGFGLSPYCNAMNWDANTASNIVSGFCNLGSHDQFVGPGGVPDPGSINVFTDFSTTGLATAEAAPGAGSGNHRKPPPGTWGEAPVSSTANPSAWDVLPVVMQDNDPIRRPCQGSTAGQVFNSGEEVCNLDGKLGVVLSIPALDFIPTIAPSGMVSYPTVACSGAFKLGNAPGALNCGPANAGVHGGECPNGDSISSCAVPINSNAKNGPTTSQCLATKATATQYHKRNVSPDGRVYNLFMMDGDTVDGAIKYIKFIPAGNTTSVDFAGGVPRIHSVQTMFASSNPTGAGCQLADATDQITCLGQADPCSFGFAGDGGKSFASRPNGNVCNTLVTNGVCACAGGPSATSGTCSDTSAACTSSAGCNAGATCLLTCSPATYADNGSTVCPAICKSPSTVVVDSVRIDTVYPNITTVQNLGTTVATNVEYQIARKLYFNSAPGFAHLTAPQAGHDTGTGELALAAFESQQTLISPILTGIGYFPFGGQSNSTYNNPFCEDFNEVMLCNQANAATVTNNNDCPNMPQAVSINSTTLNLPTSGSVCGNGTIDPYEECDDGAANNGKSGDPCSTTCRCAGTKSFELSGGSPAYTCQ